MTSSGRTRSFWLWVALAAFVVAAVAINPLRSAMLSDDWAYSLTVRHFIDTGSFHLHDWAAASPPFQTLFGGLFATLFGFSAGTLRLATLVMAFLGIIAFYKLAREHELEERQAGLLSLCWAASPLLLRMSYTFMTDVTFLTCMVTALWLYARAARTSSIASMILASLAATAAIMTRQFGIAIVAGVAIVWLMDRDLRGRAGLLVAGLVLPVAASVWQLSMGFGSPTWAQSYALAAESAYLHDIPTVALNALWRPAMLIVYLALFALPLLIPAVMELINRLRGETAPGERRRELRMGIIAVLVVAGGILVGRFGLHMSSLMPYLHESLDILKRWGKPGQIALTVVTTAGGILLCRAYLLGRFGRGSWHGALPAARLLFVTTLALLVLHIGFFLYRDEYLLAFLPFGLIAAAHYLRSWVSRHDRLIGAAALALMVASAMWVRGTLNGEEAAWTAAEMALAKSGGDTAHVFGTMSWDCYHGAFDTYVQEIGRRPMSTLDSFYVWYGHRRAGCRWAVTASPETMKVGTWEVAGNVPYQDILLTTQKIYVMRRTDAAP